MLDTLKGWLITGLIGFIVITAAVFLVLGPDQAADFVKWVGSLLTDLGANLQEFIQNLKQS